MHGTTGTRTNLGLAPFLLVDCRLLITHKSRLRKAGFRFRRFNLFKPQGIIRVNCTSNGPMGMLVWGNTGDKMKGINIILTSYQPIRLRNSLNSSLLIVIVMK